jgi:hypothetical protein
MKLTENEAYSYVKRIKVPLSSMRLKKEKCALIHNLSFSHTHKHIQRVFNLQFPTSFLASQSVTQSLDALKLGTDFSSFAIYVRSGILFQKKPISSTLTFMIRHLIR